MKDSMKKHLYYILLLTTVLMAACTQVDAPVSDDSQTPQTAADPGQGYTDKTLPVTRDKQSEGQIRLRYYSDMPSVAYVSVADFHKLMSKGQTMTVTNQDGVYTLAAGKGTATVDVRQDVFTSTTYAELISLSHLTAPGLPPNPGCDGGNFLKFIDVTEVSSFKPYSGTRFDFKKYGIDLHDDGANVYFPFATLADIYADAQSNIASCDNERVVLSHDKESYDLSNSEPDYAAKPYNRTEVSADMAKFRYNELCFAFDHFYGLPGRTMMEKAGFGQNGQGLDATLEAEEDGKYVKNLLQSPKTMAFAWGLTGLHVLFFDGGHTTLLPFGGLPKSIEKSFNEQFIRDGILYPLAADMFDKWRQDREKNLYGPEDELKALRAVRFGKDDTYYANDDKTTAVIIIDSFGNTDDDAWKKYYASGKTDADWQELLTNRKKDDMINFLYGLDRAKKDGVKNLILDLSLNSGGSSDNVLGMIGMIRSGSQQPFYDQNVMEGKNRISNLLVDRNFDGEFNSLDDTNPKYDCSGLRIGVLVSKQAFSCGNLLPALMKGYGYPIIGERSGGGSCCLQSMFTADGFQYIISSYRSRVTNQKFEDIDPGVAPTEGMELKYDDFYLLDNLGKMVAK